MNRRIKKKQMKRRLVNLIMREQANSTYIKKVIHGIDKTAFTNERYYYDRFKFDKLMNENCKIRTEYYRLCKKYNEKYGPFFVVVGVEDSLYIFTNRNSINRVLDLQKKQKFENKTLNNTWYGAMSSITTLNDMINRQESALKMRNEFYLNRIQLYKNKKVYTPSEMKGE